MPLPGRFNPEKGIRYLLYMRLGGSEGQSGQVSKISHPLGFDPRTVQPLPIFYTANAGLILHMKYFYSQFCDLYKTAKKHYDLRILLCSLHGRVT